MFLITKIESIFSTLVRDVITNYSNRVEVSHNLYRKPSLCLIDPPELVDSRIARQQNEVIAQILGTTLDFRLQHPQTDEPRLRLDVQTPALQFGGDVHIEHVLRVPVAHYREIVAVNSELVHAVCCIQQEQLQIPCSVSVRDLS